jgi:hypothetical protein
MHCDGLSLPCHHAHKPRTRTLTARRNPGPHLRHRLQRPRPHRGGADRTHTHHPGQGNEGCSAAGVCQQAGFVRRCVLQTRIAAKEILTTGSHATKGGLGPPATGEDCQGPRMEGRAQLRDDRRGHFRGTGTFELQPRLIQRAALHLLPLPRTDTTVCAYSLASCIYPAPRFNALPLYRLISF